MLRGAYFNAGPAVSGRLFLTVHHLAVDGVSWRILLGDLETLLVQASLGNEMTLPRKTTSYRRWALRLEDYGCSPALAREASFWKETLRSGESPLPVDFPDGREENTEASAREVQVALSREETERLILTMPEVYRTGMNDALLAALGLSVQRWSGNETICVDLESHGRDHPFEDVDVSRTVGWFTAIYPVAVSLRGITTEASAGREDGAGREDRAVKAVKEQQRRVPTGGLGYGVLRYLSPEQGGVVGALRSKPPPEIAFNYLGQLDREEAASELFRLSRDPSGRARCPGGRRRYLIEVNGSVSGGRLELTWTYSENVHRRETVERLADGFLDALRALVEGAQEAAAGGYTPSDFDDVDLDQEALDQILAQVDAD